MSGAQRLALAAARVEFERRGNTIASEAAEAYGVTLAVVLGRRRSKSVGVARAAVAAALREEGWTLVRIGSYLQRDHSTILYLLQAHAWRKAGAGEPFKVYKCGAAAARGRK